MLYVILRKTTSAISELSSFQIKLALHIKLRKEKIWSETTLSSIIPYYQLPLKRYPLLHLLTQKHFVPDIRFNAASLTGKMCQNNTNFILECTNSISPKDAVNAVKNIALQLSEQHGKNSAAIVSRTKAFLAENAETSDSLDTVELSHMVFPESDELAEEFVQQIHQQGIPVSIPVERTYAIREGKKHKIKTDTGIEITIPSDFFDNSEYIEFINNPNGTISISIKNVGKIINR